jgi:TonB-linked SusC/RagA family outer membrane protein
MERFRSKLWQKLLLLGVLFFINLQLFAQVKGKVSDVSGSPVPGVTIIEKGTNNGVISNADGNYSIRVRDQEAAVLVFSFVGLETQEVEVSGRTTIDITLRESTEALEEVVVVGYGTQKKESVVAAISTITSAEIVQSPTSNLTAGLAGKMPGLTIMIKDGELGAENLQTFIRGQATMNSSAPLILVDGVERSITTIDPYDVESVSILKDASATAVFGVRGANGVILVTTKKGVVGKAQVTANANYSLQTPTRLPKPLNAFDYVNLRNEVVRLDNPNNPPAFDDSVIEHLRNNDLTGFYMDRDYFGEFLHKFTPMYKANVNVQGGTEKTKYFASAGYMSQGGPFKTVPNEEYGYDNSQRLDRFTYRANIDMQITKSLKGWMNLSGYLQDKNDPMVRGDLQAAATGAESSYFRLIAKLLDEPSLATSDFLPDGVTPMGTGPYAWLNQSGYKIATTNQVNSTVGFELDMDFVTKGLSTRAIASYDARNTHRRGYRQTPDSWESTLVQSSTGRDSVAYRLSSPGIELIPVLTQSQSNTFDLEASLNYNNKFGGHAVSGLLLYKQNQEIVGNDVPFNYVGIVGRATYNYDQRYLAEVNFGMNGSEQFAEGRRFGFFPSVSLGWVLTQENFMKPVSAIEFLKIRGSFGQVGNDGISNRRFIYVDDWTQGTGGFFNGTGNIPGLPNPVYENSMANPLVSWEVANKANIGIESSFKGGFRWELDLFHEERNSILITQLAVPRYLFGQLSMPPVNDGVMTNRGFETSLSHKKKFRGDFFIMNRLSAAFARNVLEKNNESPFDETYSYPYRQEGFSRGVIFGFDAVGYFANEAEIASWADQSQLGKAIPGDIKYRDVNGDGEISAKDMVPMKFPTVPELNLSYTLNLNYKGLDFSLLLQGVSNYSFNFAGRGVKEWEGNAARFGWKNYFELHKYAWTPEKAASGGDIRYPRLHVDGISGNHETSNYWVIDLWYLRIKNVELGYSLPKRMAQSLGLENLRVYLNGMNLATFDNMPFKYFDPEVSNSLSHPIFANYNIGLNVTF